LIPSENQNLETLLYLFSEQNKKGEQKWTKLF
jgi:hypothetical protein